MKHYDVVIIGSGISSLTAAALLAKTGRSVCLLEKYHKPGGYLHCFKRFGARFDTGAHYVGAMAAGQPFRVLLEYLGVYSDELFVPLDADGFDEFYFPDFQFSMPVGYAAVIDRLSQRFPQERQAIHDYFHSMQQVVKLFPTYEFSDVLENQALLEALQTSLAQKVESSFRQPQLKALLFAYCSLHGVQPHEVSFGLHALVVDSLIRGPYGLRGGGDALAASFLKVIHAHGGEICLRTTVTGLQTQDGQVRAVETAEGEVYSGEWVISGIHPKTTFGLLDDPTLLSPAFQQRLQMLPESIGLFGVYALHKKQRGAVFSPLKNYYYFSSAEPERLFDLAAPFAPPGALFLAPADRHLSGEAVATQAMNIHAASPLAWFSPWQGASYGKRSADYNLVKEQFAQRIFAQIERYQPSFCAGVDKFVTSSPLTNLHFNGSAEGSAYGLYHSMQNSGARALGPRTHLPNLLLTGQSTLFPGLLGAAIAGLRTSGHIMGIKPLLRQLAQRRGTV